MFHESLKPSTRVLINTIAQYARSVISMVVTLFTTRLILSALGYSDYGVYSLVGGVVSMLSFISTALAGTTQRYISFHQGKKDLELLSKVWSNVLFLHIGFVFVLVAGLELVGPFLFNGFLNIESDRIHAAKVVYQCTIVMVAISFLRSPFQALLISHENIVYTSLIELCDTVLRFGVALLITFYGSDKLILYAYLLCGISIFNICASSIYSLKHYSECKIPQRSHMDKSTIRNMTSFMFWKLYSTGCVVWRTQGCAIVLNKFFGTVINMAFGIARQVSGSLAFINDSLLNAINPQIVKAEGSGDRTKMFELAMTGCKFSFFLLSILVFPFVAFMPIIIQLWLGQIPQYVVLFCRIILITALCDQITAGLITANAAIGNVRAYSLTINTIKALTVPILLVMLWFGVRIEYAFWCYAAIELICALSRIPFLHYSGGLNIKLFLRMVFRPFLIPIPLLAAVYYLVGNANLGIWTDIVVSGFISFAYILMFYKLGLSAKEKMFADNILKKIHIVK